MALDALVKKGRLEDLNPRDRFLVTIFLIALATGNRVSEISAINRNAITFNRNFKEVTLPVMEGFLYKNQTANRCPPPIVIPALNNSILCPVKALRLYLESTSNSTEDKLFLNPNSGLPLNAGTFSYWLCKSINFLLPEAICKPHDIRKLSYSEAWARGISAQEIVKSGFWSSINVFIKRYLVSVESNSKIPCVVAGKRTGI